MSRKNTANKRFQPTVLPPLRYGKPAAEPLRYLVT